MKKLQNNYGPGAKAVALRVSADRVAFFGCKIKAHQDTLLDDAGRHYYKNCYIEGDTDFICGNAASVFEVCNFFFCGLESIYIYINIKGLEFESYDKEIKHLILK